MRYSQETDEIQWKLKTETEWSGVRSLSVIRGEAFTRALQEAEEKKDRKDTTIRE